MKLQQLFLTIFLLIAAVEPCRAYLPELTPETCYDRDKILLTLDALRPLFWRDHTFSFVDNWFTDKAHVIAPVPYGPKELFTSWINNLIRHYNYQLASPIQPTRHQPIVQKHNTWRKWAMIGAITAGLVITACTLYFYHSTPQPHPAPVPPLAPILPIPAPQPTPIRPPTHYKRTAIILVASTALLAFASYAMVCFTQGLGYQPC